MFNKLTTAVSKSSQSTSPFEWNEFKHLGKGIFKINGDTQVTVGKEFLNYLATKLIVMFKNDEVNLPTNKEMVALAKGGEWEAIEQVVSRLRGLILEHGKLKYKSGETKKQVAVIHNGEIKAVTHKNYSVYDHQNIVDGIEPIKDYMSGFVLDAQKLQVVLRIKEDDTNVKFVVINGHAGLHAISYHLKYEVGKFSYKIPTMVVYDTLHEKEGFISQRNRHLGDGFQTIDNIEQGFEFLSQFSFKTQINKIKIGDLRQALKDFAQELYADDITLDILIEKARGKTSYDVLHQTALYSNTRGYQVKMQKIITATLNKILGI